MRILLSLIIGLALGAGIGLYLGWVQFPVEYVDSPASALAQEYKDTYVVNVAAAYRDERDPNAAVERLRILGVPNVPVYVQEVTERFISTSRPIEDVRHLVALAEGLGRLTQIMEEYRPIEPTETAP